MSPAGTAAGSTRRLANSSRWTARRSDAMLIALDAMGGDHAPGPIVAGAVQAVHANPDLRVLLVGDQAQVAPALAQAGGGNDRIDLFHCTQVVTMDDTPVDALRKKPDNSIKRCWE